MAGGESMMERIAKKQLEAQRWIKQQQEEKVQSELRGCTFHPIIQSGKLDFY